MIASLRGTVVALQAGVAILDVHGVGYAVQISARTHTQLQLNAEVLLHTSMIVREDSLTLFGFPAQLELQAFNLLCTVTGVGPKSALAILSALTVDELASAIASEDDAAFKAVVGVGPKTAKLICVSLAGKFGASESVPAASQIHDEIISALVGLGWNERNARESVYVASKNTTNADKHQLLKLALANLGNSKSIGVSYE